MTTTVTPQYLATSDKDQYWFFYNPQTVPTETDFFFNIESSVDNGGKFIRANYLAVDNSINTVSVKVQFPLSIALVAPYSIENIAIPPDTSYAHIILPSANLYVGLVFSTKNTGTPPSSAKIVTVAG